MRDETIAKVLAALPTEYVPLNRDGSKYEGGSIALLGSGGSSVVVRTAYRGVLPRAIKLIVPQDEYVADDSGVALFKRAFENELKLLSELSHENIARITDFGSIDLGEEQVPYFAMDLIQGETLLEFARRDETDGFGVLDALGQLMDALTFLHEREVMHCDVKPDNFLVVPPIGVARRVKGYLLDLGVAHQLSDRQDLDEFTYFFTTRRYALGELEFGVANRSHNKVKRSDIRRYFPAQDLYSLGVILKDLLADEVISRKLRKALGGDGPRALASITSGLVAPAADQTFRSVDQVHQAISRIPIDSLAPLGERTLDPTSSRGIVVPDIVGRVATAGNIEAIVSHPLFQRLHQLPQLDLMQYVLPGATHTRYTHALREMNLARKAIRYQLGNWDFRISVEVADIERTLLNALLNSVGRYQLLHMFEDFFPLKARLPKAELMTSDELLGGLMTGAGSPTIANLSKTLDSRGRTLAEVVGIGWNELQNLKLRPHDPVQGFLSGLLDSPLDVNKLSYSRADSVATGMPFGLGINHDALLEQFRVADFADWSASPAKRRGIIAIREDGISYAEAAILARYWSIQTGYWNRTNRALQSMVKYVIAELLSAEQFSFDEFLSANLHKSTSESLMWLSAAARAARGRGEIDDASVDPLEALLQSQRNAYRRLLTISPKSTVEGRDRDRKIYEAVRARSALDDGEICDIVGEVLRELLPDLQIRPGEILLDVPRATREESAGKVVVYSDVPDAAYLGELRLASPVLQNLGESFELYVKRLRIFVHPAIYAKIEPIAGTVHDALLERLRSDAEEGRL